MTILPIGGVRLPVTSSFSTIYPVTVRSGACTGTRTEAKA
jgi:hypothetical protein